MKKAVLTALMCGAMALPAFAAGNMDTQDRMAGGHSASDFASHILQKMDTNSDGVISMREHEAFNANMFHKVDANNDGQLSRQELTAYRDQHKDEWNGGRKG